MAHIRHLLRCDIDPSNPVPELAAVISTVIQCNPGKSAEILNGLSATIEQAIKEVKTDAK